MKRENPEDGIFIMDPNKNEVQGINVDDIISRGGSGFKMGGQEVATSDPDCLCKIEIVPHSSLSKKIMSPVFYVRINKAGHMYNPWGLEEGRSGALNKQSGGLEWEYSKVERGIFEQYLKFLRTRNQAHLLNAQRDNV
jgi:hypothetical protein